MQHDAHPEPREDDVRPHAQDYSYYMDMFRGVYGPICVDHGRDEISEKKGEDFDREYKAEKQLGM